MQINLQGRVVVVTGASGRLGRVVASAFSGANATVVGLYRTPPASVVGGVSKSYPVDATDETSVQAVFRQIREEEGRVDVLVHTVGAWEGRPLLDTSLAQWNALIDLNLTSAFLCFREAIAAMNDDGVLIGIASAQGADRGVAGQAAYSASKGGLVRLVESVAAEHRDRGITAHVLAPSTILYDGPSRAGGVAAGDLAAMCVYLSTPAGHALNGATLRAYGL